MKIKDWDTWQTFRKDRGAPPWIKVHRSLMTNKKWAALTDAEKGQLVSMWIAAADNDGNLPDDPIVIKKICQLDTEPNLFKFNDLGLVSFDGCQLDANLTPTRRQLDAPEQSRVEQSRAEKNITAKAVITPPREKRESDAAPCPEFFNENNWQDIPAAALVKVDPNSDLPLEWGEYAQKLNWRADQIMTEWHKLVEYFANGGGAGTRRSVKGWRRTWATWINRASRRM